MRQDGKLLAAEALKTFASPVGAPGLTPADTLIGIVRDKDYHQGAIIELASLGILDNMAQQLFRLDTSRGQMGFNRLGRVIRDLVKTTTTSRLAGYRRNVEDNAAIDLAAVNVRENNFVVGPGASATFNLDPFGLPGSWLSTPIAILGAGAAGLLVHRTLKRIGFNNILLVNKVAETHGIWHVPNVWRGSKNNPRTLTYGGVATLDAAPGAGDSVRDFLNRVKIDGPGRRHAIKFVQPSDLRHKVDTGETTPNKYPIVINCMGLGSPLPIDGKQMKGPSTRPQAVRWQNPLITREEVKGRRFIFVGLGNSTAEMLRTLHTFQDAGVDVDYHVITHIPRDALHNPTTTGEVEGKSYRVFRDLSAPNLTSFQGDLPNSRQDYLRALYSGRIVSDVKSWDTKSGKFIARAKNGKTALETEYQGLYALIGYRQEYSDLDAMGLAENTKDEWPILDWDSEVNNDTGGNYKGYFAFGAVAQAPWAKNNIVIPGMMFRLPDMLFSIIMRAGEYQHTYNSEEI